MEKLQALRLELHMLKQEIKGLLKRRPFTSADADKLKELAHRLRSLSSAIGRQEVRQHLDKFIAAVNSQTLLITAATPAAAIYSSLSILNLAFTQWLTAENNAKKLRRAGQGVAPTHDQNSAQNGQ